MLGYKVLVVAVSRSHIQSWPAIIVCIFNLEFLWNWHVSWWEEGVVSSICLRCDCFNWFWPGVWGDQVVSMHSHDQGWPELVLGVTRCQGLSQGSCSHSILTGEHSTGRPGPRNKHFTKLFWVGSRKQLIQHVDDRCLNFSCLWSTKIPAEICLPCCQYQFEDRELKPLIKWNS